MVNPRLGAVAVKVDPNEPASATPRADGGLAVQTQLQTSVKFRQAPEVEALQRCGADSFRTSPSLARTMQTSVTQDLVIRGDHERAEAISLLSEESLSRYAREHFRARDPSM
jgi:hypothetical protein